MFKKILYVIVIIAIIVVLAIMWTDSKNKNTEIQPESQAVSTNGSQNDTLEANTESSMSDELDKVDINSGIDTDIGSMDTDIKSL